MHRNQQYSISAITDGSGAISERYAYSAYGMPTITDASGSARTTTAVGNRYTFTGREWDEAPALYHYRARIYDSVSGRFVSRDPNKIALRLRFTYTYCSAIPTNRVDPLSEIDAPIAIYDECIKIKNSANAAWGSVPGCINKHNLNINCNSKPAKSGKRNVEGSTSCDGNDFTIDLNIDNHRTKDGLWATFYHEFQHATDFCQCGEGCDLLTQQIGESIDDYCVDQICPEIRAHISGGSCDFYDNGDDRRGCIERTMRRNYVDHGDLTECGPIDVERAMRSCCVPRGVVMPRFPR